MDEKALQKEIKALNKKLSIMTAKYDNLVLAESLCYEIVEELKEFDKEKLDLWIETRLLPSLELIKENNKYVGK